MGGWGGVKDISPNCGLANVPWGPAVIIAPRSAVIYLDKNPTGLYLTRPRLNGLASPESSAFSVSTDSNDTA